MMCRLQNCLFKFVYVLNVCASLRPESMLQIYYFSRLRQREVSQCEHFDLQRGWRQVEQAVRASERERERGK